MSFCPLVDFVTDVAKAIFSIEAEDGEKSRFGEKRHCGRRGIFTTVAHQADRAVEHNQRYVWIVYSAPFRSFYAPFVADATHLLPHLFQFPTPAHKDEGLSLQEEVSDFEKELQSAIDEIWTKTSSQAPNNEDTASMSSAIGATDIGTEGMQDGWAKRMREYELNSRLDPLDKVQKPDVQKVEWKQQLSRI